MKTQKYNVSNIERTGLKQTLKQVFHDEATQAVLDAVNSHEALLGLAKAVQHQFTGAAAHSPLERRWLEMANNAIAKAGGK